MANASTDTDVRTRADAVEGSFRLQDGLYVIGSFERGVTVYSQQLRAHNLVWALWELQRRKGSQLKRVAVVGGGIAGLTAAAALLARFGAESTVTLFEQRWDLCPFQQGADSRWLHPRIYDWPAAGSRAPDARLPVLNWSEARASDVARIVLKEFSLFCDAFDKSGNRLKVLLGLRHFRIHAGTRRIDWIATRARRTQMHFQIGAPEGSSAEFDLIILAAGFGLETQYEQYPTPSYWRNEQLGQPSFEDRPQHYVISGFGDGALVDLCRLTIERFRQDTILRDLFPSTLENVEERLADETSKLEPDVNLFQYFHQIEDEVLQAAKEELGQRIRKDTRVTLHAGGTDGHIKSFSEVFLAKSSFLNRLLLFILYRCGAFGVSLGTLEETVIQSGTPSINVICRHGAKSLEHIGALFIDRADMDPRLAQMKQEQKQEARELWEVGTFPHYSSPTPT